MTAPTSLHCPLCSSKKTGLLCTRNDSGFGARDYFRCPDCALVFLSPEHRLAPAEERKRYDSHENDPADSRYLDFLKRLAEPVRTRLREPASGLDYGCGPGPAMGRLFEGKGWVMKEYDPIYRPQESLLEQAYDFVTCSEVAEHFHSPREEFLRLERLLKPGAILGVMTCMIEDENTFQTWWYPNDPTHVSFYRRQTFEWIAHWRNWKLEIPAPNVAIFRA